MRGVNWNNIPIPEAHVALLIVGGGLHWWHPLRLFPSAWLGHVLGWPLLLAGVLLAAWAVVAVGRGSHGRPSPMPRPRGRGIGDVDTSKPTRIIDTGPYARSRNPMYVAWTLIYLAAALIANTWWLIILLPLLAVFTHYFVVRREERQLERQFGGEYLRYCARVRRYL